VARVDSLQGGAFAERAIAPARLVARVPQQLGREGAAAFGAVGATAWQAVFEAARITPATKLLVTGGAGSVGAIAVQLACSIGARVFATMLARDLETANNLGAERAFDSAANLDLDDVDLVFDTVSGDGQRRLFSVLRGGGMLASIANPPDEQAGRARGITTRFVFHESNGAARSHTSYCAARGIKPAIARVMPLQTCAPPSLRAACRRTSGRSTPRPGGRSRARSLETSAVETLPLGLVGYTSSIAGSCARTDSTAAASLRERHREQQLPSLVLHQCS
jgi:NADPH:quinone reductase-like Zn-dependent oxidoreductase